MFWVTSVCEQRRAAPAPPGRVPGVGPGLPGGRRQTVAPGPAPDLGVASGRRAGWPSSRPPGSLVHTPLGPRKSGMPESVEMPAPVSTSTRRPPSPARGPAPAGVRARLDAPSPDHGRLRARHGTSCGAPTGRSLAPGRAGIGVAPGPAVASGDVSRRSDPCAPQLRPGVVGGLRLERRARGCRRWPSASSSPTASHNPLWTGARGRRGLHPHRRALAGGRGAGRPARPAPVAHHHHGGEDGVRGRAGRAGGHGPRRLVGARACVAFLGGVCGRHRVPHLPGHAARPRAARGSARRGVAVVGPVQPGPGDRPRPGRAWSWCSARRRGPSPSTPSSFGAVVVALRHRPAAARRTPSGAVDGIVRRIADGARIGRGRARVPQRHRPHRRRRPHRVAVHRPGAGRGHRRAPPAARSGHVGARHRAGRRRRVRRPRARPAGGARSARRLLVGALFVFPAGRWCSTGWRRRCGRRRPPSRWWAAATSACSPGSTRWCSAGPRAAARGACSACT